MKAFVAVSTDHDCDGIGYGFHFFTGETGSSQEAEDYLRYDCGAVPLGCKADEIYTMPLTTFYARMEHDGWPDRFDRDYFMREGYFGYFNSRYH